MTILKLDVQEETSGIITVEIEARDKSKETEDALDLLLKAFCVPGARRGKYTPNGKLVLAIKPSTNSGKSGD